MSDTPQWGEEWSAEYVQEKLSSLSATIETPVTTPVDGYEKAAAVLEYFDPNELKPASGEQPSTKQQLLANSTVVWDQDGHLRAMLRSERRRAALEQMKLDGIREALDRNPRPQSTVQQVFEAFVYGKAPVVERQSLAELAATLQTAEWLKDIAPGLPDTSEVQRRLERESLLRPFRELAGQAFAGRQDELGRLQKYVAFLPSTSLLETLGRNARSFFNWHEKPPMVIHGPGGMGKSALVARFILNHLEPGNDILDELPFVYLDFDRASLVPERPLALLLEAGRQLSAQFPKTARAWHQIQPQWTGELQRPTPSADLLSRMPADFMRLLQSGQLLERPLLFVLDTFEEVQYRSRDFVEEVFRFLALLQQSVPRLRVVVIGRAPVSLDKYPTENNALGPLSSDDAKYYMRTRGLSSKLAEAVADQVGGNPLSLRLALEVINKEGAGRRGIEGLQTRNAIYIRLQDSQIQGQLYRRILGHIHRDDVARLAHPGLVLRRITADLIYEVLAQPCGVSVPDIDAARSLFGEMQREVSLVTVAEDGSLRHLPEVRRVMIELLRKDDPVKVRDIQERAIGYYDQLELALASEPEPRWLTARAERLYHMLALGRPRDELEKVWTPGLDRYVGDVLEELPPPSRAWLAPRIGRDIDQSTLSHTELPDWELYAVQRVTDNLRLAKPEVALDVLRERAARTYASPVYVVQAQALILAGDLTAARAAIATGLRELQDPDSLLKLTVMASWVDRLYGEALDEKEATQEFTRINRRFGDDPRVLRFGLHRLVSIHDAWFRAQFQDLLAEIAGRVPETRLSLYNLLARDLAEQVGTRVPALLVRLVQLFGLGSDTMLSEATSKLLSYLREWDYRTGILTRFRVNSPESLVRNLGLLSDRVGLSEEVLSSVAAKFAETIPPGTPQALYEEMEIESRGVESTGRRLQRLEQQPAGLSLLYTLTGHRRNIFRLAWSPDGQRVATPCVDGTLRLWDALTGQMLCEVSVSRYGVNQVTWSPDGTHLAAACFDHITRVWSVSLDGRHLAVRVELKQHNSDVRCGAWSPKRALLANGTEEGALLATGTEGGTVRFWDTRQWSQLALVGRRDDRGVNVLGWSPDGRLLAFGCESGAVALIRRDALDRVEDLTTATHIDRSQDAPRAITALAWSPRRYLLAIGTKEGSLAILNPSQPGSLPRYLTGPTTKKGPPRAHDRGITALSFAYDEFLLASKGLDNRVRFWRCDTWEMVAELEETAAWFTLAGMAWHPSRYVLATLTDEERSVRVWEVNLGLRLAYSSWRTPKWDAQFGQDVYRFDVVVEAPEDVLDRIEYVEYRLPPAWPATSSPRRVDDRQTKFKLKELAWADLAVRAVVVFKTQAAVISLECDVKLMETGPRI